MAVTWFFTLLLLSMSGYIIYYSATHKQELINNSYNGRQQMLLAQNRRGSIYSGDGQILARTVEGEDGKEVREYPYGNLFFNGKDHGAEFYALIQPSISAF